MNINHVATQYGKFGAVGLTATGVNYLSVIFFVHSFHIAPLIANLFAFILACHVSFFGHKKWTFASTKATRSALPKFLLIAITGLIISEILFFMILHYTHLHYTLALALVVCTVPPITFALNKYWTFVPGSLPT